MHPFRWSRLVTTAAVLLLAVIAAVVSYSHMFELALRHGEPQWRAALFPLSVDGMIVASSMALLNDARQGNRGGLLPWSLLILGSAASLAANVAVADPSLWSRVIHAWPSFALMGAYELLMRQFRATAPGARTAYADNEHTQPSARPDRLAEPEVTRAEQPTEAPEPGEEQQRPQLRMVDASSNDREENSDNTGDEPREPAEVVPQLQVEAWRWALTHRHEDGSLPSGKEIATHFARKDRWGRLVKQRGQQGRFDRVVA
ncbi:DUF2637 domain-containing protein [Salinactinospora qingdaonensis]|uniref:DUF2637 domain-containing protein n=1 Tax=Salinactinospora qingdaonensis TaxID=702744 RepID=A0ABP7GAN7_9ACTN